MQTKDKQGLPKSYDPALDDMLALEDSNVVASSTECTGLTPSAIQNGEESESYTDIYPVPLPGQEVDNRLQKEQGIGPAEHRKGKKRTP